MQFLCLRNAKYFTIFDGYKMMKRNEGDSEENGRKWWKSKLEICIHIVVIWNVSNILFIFESDLPGKCSFDNSIQFYDSISMRLCLVYVFNFLSTPAIGPVRHWKLELLAAKKRMILSSSVWEGVRERFSVAGLLPILRCFLTKNTHTFSRETQNVQPQLTNGKHPRNSNSPAKSNFANWKHLLKNFANHKINQSPPLAV